MTSENDYLVERVNDTGHVILVFSHFAVKSDTPPPFAYRHLFDRLGYNRVYVRDRENQWYNRAVNGLGAELGEVTEGLRGLLAANGFDVIDCIGNSMGAYAALLFGARLRARNVLAFSPQTFLAPPYPRYAPSSHDGDYVDFRDLDIPGCIDNPRILASEDELFDLYSLGRLPYWRKLDTTFIRGSSHLVPKTLNDLGVLERMIGQFFDDGTLSVPDECRSGFDLGACRKDLVKAIEAHYGRRDAIALRALGRLLATRPDWAGAHLWAGKAYQRIDRRAEAVSHLEIAWRLNPAQYEAAVDLARLHVEREEFPQALTLMEQACLLNHVLAGPRNRIAGQALDHAEALLAAGREAEALALADRLRLPFRYALAAPLLERLAAFPFVDAVQTGGVQGRQGLSDPSGRTNPPTGKVKTMDAAHDILLAQIDRLARDAAIDMLQINQDGLIDDLLARKNAAIEGLRERLTAAEADLAQALAQNATYADLRKRISNLDERAVSAEKELAFLRDHIQQDWHVRHRWTNARLAALTEMLARAVLGAPPPLAAGITMLGLTRQDQAVPGLPVGAGRPVAAPSYREAAGDGPHALELAVPVLPADGGLRVNLAVLPVNRRFLALGWRKQDSTTATPLAVLDLFEGSIVRTSSSPAWLRVTAAGAGWSAVEATLPADIREGCLVLSTALSGIGADRFPGDCGCGFALQGPLWAEEPSRR